MEPHLDPLHSSDGPPPTVAGLATILLVGAASLLAGASLGPEAALVGLSAGLGGWAAARVDTGPPGRALVLASVGALLVAFFGSLIALLIPVLILWQRAKRLDLVPLCAIVVAGLAAYVTLGLLKGDHQGYGDLPSDAVRARDYASAFVLGGVAVGLGVALRWSVRRLARLTRRIDAAVPWWLAAAGVGTVLGGLYLAGGPAVQFSGSEGSAILLGDPTHYSLWALAGIALIKLLATGWSLAAGYRGGLVFPSVLVGVAFSLFASGELADLSGPGILLGCLAGLLVEMTAPLLGAVMLLALLPPALLPLGLVGAAGAVLMRTGTERLSSNRRINLARQEPIKGA